MSASQSIYWMVTADVAGGPVTSIVAQSTAATALTILTQVGVTGSTGQSFSYPMGLMPRGGITPRTFALASGSLPNGLSLNTSTGEITINGLSPVNDIAYPAGATHIALKGAWAKIDFATNVYDVQLTNTEILPIDGALTSLSLLPATAPSGSGTNLFLLQLEFLQEVNTNQYSLKNGAYNSLCIVEVS
jgi:hypothetical protein